MSPSKTKYYPNSSEDEEFIDGVQIHPHKSHTSQSELDMELRKPLNSLQFIDPKDEEWEEKMVEFAPDGGIAWLVVFASLMNNFVLDGVSFSYGVLSDSVKSDELTEFQFHICGSVMLGNTLTIGPIVSLLGNRIGYRPVSILGSLVAAIGFLISWGGSPNKPNFVWFLVGFGILGGIGFGLMFTSSIVILGKFFKVNLPLATGIATTGSAAGSIVMPFVLEVITKCWGWQGSFLFMAGCCLISTLFGAMYVNVPKRVEKVLKNPIEHSDLRDLVELLSSPTFWILCLSGGIVVLGYFVPSAFLPQRAEESPFNATSSEGNALRIIIGASNTIGRVFFGLLANSERAVHSILFTNIAVTFGGLATVASVFATKYWMLVIYAIIFGQIIAVYASLRSVIVNQIVGKDKLSLAFGVSVVLMGIPLYFSTSLAELLKGETGDYDASFYATGGFFLLSAMLCYPLNCIHKREMRSKVTGSKGSRNIRLSSLTTTSH